MVRMGSINTLVKVAYELKEHQERVANRAANGDSLLVYHSLGSGKSLTSLDAAIRKIKAGQDKVRFVVPAPLRQNMRKEMEKHDIPEDIRKKIHIESYEKVARNPDAYAADGIDFLVMDEAHRIRNEGTARSAAIKKLVGASKQRMLLTGSPIYNKRTDIASLINATAGQKIMPDDIDEFDKRYIQYVEKKPGIFMRMMGVEPGVTMDVKNKKELKDIGHKYIDKYDAKEENPQDFPTTNEKTVEVPMGDKQYETYRYLEGDIPFHIRLKISHNLPLNKKESKNLNAFVTGVRQASNTNAAYIKDGSSPEGTKVDKVLSDISERHGDGTGGHRGVVYSTYLDSGLKQLSQKLTERGIKHEIFNGSLNDRQRKEMVLRYNNGETPWLLISSSGTEGLDLKGTRSMHIMEPHFNEQKIKQVLGRGVRYHSHHHLPVEDRNVETIRYVSTRPKLFGKFDRGISIDQYLTQMSKDKENLHERILRTMTS